MVSDPRLLRLGRRGSDIYFHPSMDPDTRDTQPGLGRLLDIARHGKQSLRLSSTKSLSTYNAAFYHHGERVHHFGGHQWPRTA